MPDGPHAEPLLSTPTTGWGAGCRDLLWKPEKLAVLRKHHCLGWQPILPPADQNNSESELLSSGEGRASVQETQGMSSATRSSTVSGGGAPASDTEPALSYGTGIFIPGSIETMKEVIPALDVLYGWGMP